LPTLEAITETQYQLAENPLWHQDALWWIDINAGDLHRYDPVSGEQARYHIHQPLGVAWPCANGDWLFGTDTGFALWNINEQTLRMIAEPEAGRPHTRFNDGAVDARGRFWSGTIDKDGQGILYRLDPDGTVQQMDSGFHISNGIDWNLDHTIMYFTDSTPRAIYAYDFDLETGSIRNRRIFAQPPVGVPDGLCVDSEGYVLSANYNGSQVIRFAPEGTIAGQIALPAERATSCVYGGDDLQTLYITTATEGFTEAERQAKPDAGRIYRIRVDVPGQAMRLFDPQL